MNRTSTRNTRHKRVRAKITGTGSRPRLSVFRSNRGVTIQLIDDTTGKTLGMVRDTAGAKAKKKKETRQVRAERAGEKIAEIAKEKKIVSVIFDRGGYTYHGIVKAIAEGARKGGLKF